MGWPLNSSRFGNFVPGSTYFLQSFLGNETGTKNIRHLVNLKTWVPLLKMWVLFGCGPEKVSIMRAEKVVPIFSPPIRVL